MKRAGTWLALFQCCEQQAGDIRTRAGTSSDHAPHSTLILFDHGICADCVLFLYSFFRGAQGPF